jgi:putative tryptophan/tyrosine transport system substrate-binding protein
MHFHQWKRREVITLLGGAAAAWPLAARAQQSERIGRIGVLMGTSDSDADQTRMVAVFTQALSGLGWKEGANINIDYRWAAGDSARLQAHAAELARLGLDAIFVQGTPATTALRRAAPTTPLVFVNVTDPITTGLVSSLAHPGGNITGFTNYEFSMGGKWLEILKEISPGLSRVAAIFNPDNPVMPQNVRSIEAAAPILGIQISARPARNAQEFEQAIIGFGSEPNGGMLVLLDFLTLAHRELIIGLATRHRLPTGYGLRVFATSGGLFSYGVDPVDLFHRAASYVDRILKGAKPADLPVQQPNKFELVINVKAAGALGLEVPPTLLARADEVIE